MSKSIFRRKSVSKILADVASGFSDSEHPGSAPQLEKALNVKDLTLMGIAAVVGAGIFSTIGEAAFQGGPGVSVLFIITAVTCGFSALCYAEFASRIPVAGSAYTYAYASFGELIAWIIGWDLLMEYAIGNIAVAISWSKYFVNLLEGFSIHMPKFLYTDYLSAFRAHEEVTKLTVSHNLAAITDTLKENALAWTTAPMIGNIKLIANIPALAIVCAITYLVYIGIRETKKATNAMVYLKIAIVLVVIVIGFFYVTPANWHPFLPNGFGGVMKGVSGVFFAYIGFDAISTTAEECQNPQKDLPRGMIYSLVICTVLYVLIALVLTGMVSYKELRVGDPLAFVFAKVGLKNISYVISISAVIATASVLLIFQLGQPRIWMSMSRDGLLPKVFSRIHPKYHTPSFATIVTGFVVGVPALFLNLTVVTDLTSIGTLFAFVLVCGGVLLLPREAAVKGKFHLPYINSQFIVPVLFIVGVFFFRHNIVNLVSGEALHHKFPYFLFIILSASLAVLSFVKKLSLIPVLGLASCFYLMAELDYDSWIRFLAWLIIGLVIYFTYGYKHSKLGKGENAHLAR
ncbi:MULTISPECIES: amino acid permease [unclassified Mucilaginibacter]|uniref:amino acid permease n=1 Tax=unclassified Mucilaginibacter TaxID=2617802 RepID=UPI002AC9E3E8|nr:MULTISPECIES: amino acid permease [unclassified Mucilaginibacter]MEB0261294.1 amino acid permease [Mucilaginibacter sp. 10I4]MEB0280443.1 amino acid permease [Mucilaginibacter sp. 10B2]MEB0300447.1 amino acid permease [Mucilaginibacter sp. 5C4]WPX23118.1 amino acid permease [Mucilaginibacter sp. 5C4]